MLGYIRKRPDLSFWQEQIEKGTEFRKRSASEDDWEQWRKYYRGEWDPSVCPTNLLFKMIRTLVPRVYFRNPSVSVRPSKPGFESIALAKIVERIDNRLIREMRVKQQIKRMVQHAVMFGTGFGKLGFSSQISTELEEGERTRFEYNSLVQEGFPWFMAAHPGTIILPAGLQRFEDTPWIIHHIRKPVQEVLEDPRFQHKDEIGPSSKGLPGHDTVVQDYVEMVDLYEVTDKRTGRVFVIAPRVTDKILLEDEHALAALGRLPFYPLIFNEDDERFWGIPDAKILEPLVLEMNATKTTIRNHRRLSVMRILAGKGSISEAEAARLLEEDGQPAVIWTQDVNGVKPIQPAGIPEDLLANYEFQMRDVRETLGFGQNQFGEYKPGSGDTTATEAQIVAMATEIRIDERRDMVADLLTELLEDVNRLIFDNWTGEQVIDLVGPAGMRVWVSFSGDLLKKGAYSISIDPDSSLPETKALRERRAIQVYQLLRQDPNVNQEELTRYLLRELQGVQMDNLLATPAPGVGMSPDRPMSFQEFVETLQNGANLGVPVPGQPDMVFDFDDEGNLVRVK